jgi:tetratricopeptide (TPR) repeat protein
LRRLDQNEEALAALGHASPAELDAEYWIMKGLMLEKLTRTDEAYQAFSQGIETATKSPDSRSAHYFFQQRSAFLQRQNRLAEAAKDVCAAKGIPVRDPAAKPNLIDLTLGYSTSLTNLQMLGAGDDAFSELPTGIHAVGGTEFDIRGLVCSRAYQFARPSVTAIPVNLRCRALHFLQGAAYAYLGPGNDSRGAGRYTVHYEDQRTQEIPVFIGRHLQDWFYFEGRPVEASEAPVVWVGLNARTRDIAQTFVRLYKMSWTNPFPDLQIKSIDFEAEGSSAMPFLIALTAQIESAPPPTGVPPGASQKEAVMVQTLATLEQALQNRPGYPAFVSAEAALLERLGRTNEAQGLWSRAITEAEAKGAPATNVLNSALLGRSALLRRLNRPGEAQTDWLRASHIPPREPQTSPNLLDLTAYYNSSLTHGWIPSSRAGMPRDRNLDELPRGVQEMAGVQFDVRGLIQVAGSAPNGTLGAAFPAEVKGISADQKCRRLHFLHGTGSRVADGTLIGRYLVHYAGGEQKEVPIIYGETVRDWWCEPEPSEPTQRATVAWTGKNAAAQAEGMALRLYKFTWENPLAEAMIESIDLVSANSNSSPFLVAITAEP